MHADALAQLFFTFAAVLLLVLLRSRRMATARPLKTESLWIVPTIFAAITALTVWQSPPSIGDAPWLAGLALLGAIVGWRRGKMMRITVDPQTHALSQAASPFAVLFLIVVVGLRYGLRYVMGEEAHAWGISLSVIADAPLVFAVAMLAVQRLEMFIRAEKLLTEARATHATGPVTDQPGAN